MASWVEIDKVRDENRHELVLTGDDIGTRISQNGVDGRLFQLTALNFLEISKCGLRAISEEIENLVNLTNLVFHGNKITSLPECIGQLQKLKYLDLSNNELRSVPETVGTLKELQTLNLGCNKLSSFIDPSGLVQLHILDLSHNCLQELPENIASAELALLGTLMVQNNGLQLLPENLCELPALKYLDVSDNKLTEIPASICNCAKLKEFKYGGNKLKDRRLAKMMDQCSTRAVLDYLRITFDKELKATGGAGAGDKKDKKKHGAKDKPNKDSKNIEQNTIRVLHFSDTESVVVHVTTGVSSVRPYIVCCIVRNLNFSKSETMMRRFIVLQTKLHDGICNKRQAATIATHDFDALRGPLTYDARLPTDIQILPLMKKTVKTAAALVLSLRHEAEELRKEKKRNTVSGIHRYLDLLKGKSHYPCLIDSTGTIISFPPITNSDVTKVTQKTRNIFVEVTSTQSLDVCKKVMEELLSNLLAMGVGQADTVPLSSVGEQVATPSCDAESSDKPDTEVDDVMEDLEIGDHSLKGEQTLVVQQVKVVDSTGSLKVIYPSRVDLQSKSFEVIRDYE